MPYLEVLDLVGLEGQAMDWLFCGITHEEVEEVVGKGIEYLQKVNIVSRFPPMPLLRVTSRHSQLHHQFLSTDLRLELQLTLKGMNLSPLRILAPNIISIEVAALHHPLCCDADILVCSQIWQLWPHLEEISITGRENNLGRNKDADFCGIYEEEASYLREQPEEFLEAVHTVPIKPSQMPMASEYSYCE